jgi:hypothetical protein
MFRKNNLYKEHVQWLRFQAKFCANKNEAKKANSEIVKFEQGFLRLLNFLLNLTGIFIAILLALVVFNSMY